MNRGSEGAVDALVSHSAIRGVSRGGDGMRSCIGIGVGARARVIWGSFVCGGGAEWGNGEQVVRVRYGVLDEVCDGIDWDYE